MAICEKCGKEHDGSYGSGRFCSRHCANKRSISKKQRELISKLTKARSKKEYKPILETRICEKCAKEFVVDVKKENKKKPKRFCSRSCANGHIISEETKEKISKSSKRFFNTKEGKRKAKKVGQKLKQQYIDNPELRLLQAERIMKAQGNSNPSRIIFTCPVCGKQLELRPYEARKRKFCSGHCRNIVNNEKITGSRSKAEIMLEEFLKENYPQIKFKTSERDLLQGLELDFYFPEIKFAIEWNGIFHYRDVGHNIKAIQKKDEQKKQLCIEKDIELYIVKDMTSHKKSILQEIKKIEKILKEKYNI